MEYAHLIRRVREELGDPVESFRTLQQGDGQIAWFNLPNRHVNTTGFAAEIIDGASSTPLVHGADYVMNFDLGEITMTVPVPAGATLIISGSTWSMFSDTDLYDHARDAVNWHCWNRETVTRYRSGQGFITYREDPMTLENLPQVEEPLLVMRMVWNCLWVLATDLSTETNVQTSEGTTVDRGQRYRQVMEQISAVQDRYKQDCLMLNAGPYRWESVRFRRVSQRTGRLIPLYKRREYDDIRYPTRLIPPIDSRNEDNSGIPSQIGFGIGGYAG